jgi:hypothetical protein
VEDYKPRPDRKEYKLVSDKPHEIITDEGVRKLIYKGETAMLTDVQFANFKDKFIAADRVPAVEAREARLARLKAELAETQAEIDAEAAAVANSEGGDETADLQTGKPGEQGRSRPDVSSDAKTGGGPTKSPPVELPKDSKKPA